MVTRILVEEGIAEGNVVFEVAAATASIKKENIKSEDTTDDDGDNAKLSSTTTAAVTRPNTDSNGRKRKADTLDLLVKGEPVTAESVVQDTDYDDTDDPLIHLKRHQVCQIVLAASSA